MHVITFKSGIADALFSRTRQKLLALIFSRPEEVYTLSELIERARAGSGAVQREVVRLVDCGLVLQEGTGRVSAVRNFWRVNLSNCKPRIAVC